MNSTHVIVLLTICFLFNNCAPKGVTVSETVQATHVSTADDIAGREKKESVSSSKDDTSFISDDLDFEPVSIEKLLSKDFNFNLRYPRLVNAEGVDAVNVSAFNYAAANIVNESFDNFSWLKEGKENLEGFLSSSYEITYADANLISVSYITCTICCGAATAGCYAHVLNFDLQRGKPINSKEIFQSRSNYLSTLYTYCEANLSNSYGANRVFGGKDDVPKNYKQLAVTRQGIKVMFDECIYLPCNVGVHSVLVPYAVIKDKLNSQSPITKIAMQAYKK